MAELHTSVVQSLALTLYQDQEDTNEIGPHKHGQLETGHRKHGKLDNGPASGPQDPGPPRHGKPTSGHRKPGPIENGQANGMI